MTKPVIKVLNRIYKNGYVASRGLESYIFNIQEDTMAYQYVNCFGHACFNLKNQHFIENNLTPADTNCFGGLIECHELSAAAYSKLCTRYILNRSCDKPEEVTERLFDTVTSAGLVVDKCLEKSILKNNQWKIALYFRQTVNNLEDYHFLLQEKDGKWSSKMGHSKKLDLFEQPEETIYHGYKIHGIYSITNPYAKSDKGAELTK